MRSRAPHGSAARTSFAIASWIVVIVTTSGCGYFLRSPGRPTPAIHYRADADRRAECLLVLLPGILDTPEEFARRGVVDDLHRVAPGCDLVAVETHLYDYADESIVVRVHEDIVLPARERGYRRIWLIGVSMGAIGAILTAREHPEDVDGLVLVSPYLGNTGFARRLEREVLRAGGLARWASEGAGAPVQIARVLHDPRPIWRWLAGYRTTPEAMPPLWVAYGRDDRFAAAQGLLALAIAPEQSLVVEGRHDWTTWRRLCQDVFAEIPLEVREGPSSIDTPPPPPRSLVMRPHGTSAW